MLCAKFQNNCATEISVIDEGISRDFSLRCVSEGYPILKLTSREIYGIWWEVALQCRDNEHEGVSNHRRPDCLFSRLFRRRSKKTKLRVTGLCEGNPLLISGFPSQTASDARNVSIWWRHHVHRQSIPARLIIEDTDAKYRPVGYQGTRIRPVPHTIVQAHTLDRRIDICNAMFTQQNTGLSRIKFNDTVA